MNASELFGSSESLQSALTRLMDPSGASTTHVASSSALVPEYTGLHDMYRQSLDSMGLGFNVDASSVNGVMRSPARSESMAEAQEALFSPQANRVNLGDASCDFAQLLTQVSQRSRTAEALNFDPKMLLKSVLNVESQAKDNYDAQNLSAVLTHATVGQSAGLDEQVRKILHDGEQQRVPAESPQSSAAHVLAATQSLQLNQKLHMQAAETQKLQTENLLLLRELHNANQQILALQEQIQLLKLTLEKSQTTAQYAQEEQLQRESLLQQHNAQLTAKQLDYEQHLKKLQEELAEAKRQCMRLERANGMLSLGIPQTVHPQHKWPRSVGENRTPSSIASRKCYNCGEKGHKATDCPNPRTRHDGATDASSIAASNCCSPTGSPSPGSPMSAATSPPNCTSQGGKIALASPCSSSTSGPTPGTCASSAPPPPATLVPAADGV